MGSKHNAVFPKGASVNARDMEGRSALFLAASVEGAETVQVLMDHNADVAMKDLGSRSVLTAAIRSTNTIEALTKVRHSPTKQSIAHSTVVCSVIKLLSKRNSSGLYVDPKSADYTEQKRK